MTSLFSTFVIAAVIGVQSAQSLSLSSVDNMPAQVKPEPPKVFAQVNAFVNPIGATSVDAETDANLSDSDDDLHCSCKKECPCPHLQDCGIVVGAAGTGIGEI